MSNSVKKIYDILGQHKADLSRSYGVKAMGVFGSFARGDATKKSDVDILVEFVEPIGLFKFVELEQKLSSLVGRKVDLVTKQALKPYIKNDVLKQTIYV